MDHDTRGGPVAGDPVPPRRWLHLRIARQSPTHDRAGRTRGTRSPRSRSAIGSRPSIPFPPRWTMPWPGIDSCSRAASAAKRIAVAGESAGGGLAIAMLVSAREAGLELPACTWCSSPWVDLEMTGGSMTTKAAVDPLISKPYLEELATAYLNGADPRTPLASPIHADLRGLPPLLIQVGSCETLLDDAIRLAGRAGAAGVRVTLDVWPDMIHAWTCSTSRSRRGGAPLPRSEPSSARTCRDIARLPHDRTREQADDGEDDARSARHARLQRDRRGGRLLPQARQRARAAARERGGSISASPSTPRPRSAGCS